MTVHEREPLEAHMLAGISTAMREKLAERRHHGDWRGETPRDLLMWLRDEVHELFLAICHHDHTPAGGDRAADTLEAIRSECADVACLAGMILDSIERLPVTAGDTEAARWAARNRELEARLQAVREAAK